MSSIVIKNSEDLVKYLDTLDNTKEIRVTKTCDGWIIYVREEDD